MFIKTVFEATFSLSNILKITNQIDNIKSFTSNMRFDVVGLTCRMKSVLITAMFWQFVSICHLPYRSWQEKDCRSQAET